MQVLPVESGGNDLGYLSTRKRLSFKWFDDAFYPPQNRELRCTSIIATCRKSHGGPTAAASFAC